MICMKINIKFIFKIKDYNLKYGQSINIIQPSFRSTGSIKERR